MADMVIEAASSCYALDKKRKKKSKKHKKEKKHKKDKKHKKAKEEGWWPLAMDFDLLRILKRLCDLL